LETSGIWTAATCSALRWLSQIPIPAAMTARNDRYDDEKETTLAGASFGLELALGTARQSFLLRSHSRLGW